MLFRLFLTALVALLPLSAAAQGSDYETLLADLAAARTAAEADSLASQIWVHWLTAPEARAQELMDEAMSYRARHDPHGAIEVLDVLVAEYPGYAEGWNQRATMYFFLGEFELSLADVDEVLAIEPRHFGALSGRAIIYLQMERLGLAQVAVQEALRHHPFLAERAILDINPGDDI